MHLKASLSFAFCLIEGLSFRVEARSEKSYFPALATNAFFTYIYSQTPNWVGILGNKFLNCIHSASYKRIFFGICSHFQTNL